MYLLTKVSFCLALAGTVLGLGDVVIESMLPNSPNNPNNFCGVVDPTKLDLWSWLTPDRLPYLLGGYWEWHGGNNQILVPGSDQWVAIFGEMPYLRFLQLLGGHFKWNDVFGWINPNIIPNNNGGTDWGTLFGWLTPDRLNLLHGGRWDPAKLVWYTQTGGTIVPGTPDWNLYFGPILPDHLNLLFPNGGRWDNFFYWVTPDFLQNNIKPDNYWWWWSNNGGNNGNGGGFGTWTPDISNWFNQGWFSWLTPDRLQLLQGGWWDLLLQGWRTGDGKLIKPGTDQWTLYFGDLNWQKLLQLLNGKYGWTQVYGWLTPQLLLNLQGGGDWTSLFGWLTPDRLQLLQGGHFDLPNLWWVNGGGDVIKPGTPQWIQYFGYVFGPNDLKLLFPFGGNWNDYYGWITPGWITQYITIPNKWTFIPPKPTEAPRPPPCVGPQCGNPPCIGPQCFPPPCIGPQCFPPPCIGPQCFQPPCFGPGCFQPPCQGLNCGGTGGWLIPPNWGQLGIPQQFLQWFQGGQMNWLTPDKLHLLQGGRWDPLALAWYTGKGDLIRPGTPQWLNLFGTLSPQDLNLMFPNGGSWDALFGWIKPQFVAHWQQLIPNWKPLGPPNNGFIFPPNFNWQQFGVPQNFQQFFQNGQLNWLNPDRWQLLQGGRWDPGSLTWFTPGGLQIRPGTPQWVQYFGDLQPNNLNQWFPNGGSWNQVFGWIQPNFFNVWQGWQQPTIIPWRPPTNFNWGQFNVPQQFQQFFQNGQLNWLNPQRWQLLQGGRWDPGSLTWFTPSGVQVRPGTPDWTLYFGDLQPNNLNLFFPNGGSWNQAFGWLQPGFFQQWQGWQQQPQPIPDNNGGGQMWSVRIPSNLAPFFQAGQLNWLNPDRFKLLQGGRFDPVGLYWVTGQGTQIRPGTPDWTLYFGNLQPQDLKGIFANGESWEQLFGWMKPTFFDQWLGWKQGGGGLIIPPNNGGGGTFSFRVPSNLAQFFQGGQLNWLNPDRFKLLQGGRFDPNGLYWVTGQGTQIRPGTPDWTVYFGNLQPQDLKAIFANGESWEQLFGWMQPDFFTQWLGWQQVPQPPVWGGGSVSFQIPGDLGADTMKLFGSGGMNWLTPQRIQMLSGGRWDPVKQIWYTSKGVPVNPGSAQWSSLFGDFNVANMKALFPFGGAWDSRFGFLNNVIKQLPPQALQSAQFEWSQMFSGSG